jgi:hypothetical protein
MMPGGAYILCAITSLACALLLWRGYRKSGVRLLFWSGICFFGLALDNVVAYFDVVVVPNVDLTLYRRWPGLISLAALLFGLIWESD